MLRPQEGCICAKSLQIITYYTFYDLRDEQIHKAGYYEVFSTKKVIEKWLIILYVTQKGGHPCPHPLRKQSSNTIDSGNTRQCARVPRRRRGFVCCHALAPSLGMVSAWCSICKHRVCIHPANFLLLPTYLHFQGTENDKTVITSRMSRLDFKK